MGGLCNAARVVGGLATSKGYFQFFSIYFQYFQYFQFSIFTGTQKRLDSIHFQQSLHVFVLTLSADRLANEPQFLYTPVAVVRLNVGRVCVLVQSKTF